MRSVEFALGVTNGTGDPSHLDHFNFNTAIPEISEYQGTPGRWMNDENAKKAIAEARETQRQASELISNAGNLAGAAKTMTDIGEQGA